MDNHRCQRDETLDTLEFPLRNAEAVWLANPAEMTDKYIHDDTIRITHHGTQHPQADIAPLQIGAIVAVAVRVTACATSEEGTGYGTLAMMFAGEPCSYKDGISVQNMEAGDIHLNPRTGGSIIREGCFSGILCDIDHRRLRRTISAMKGSGNEWNPEASYMLKGGDHANRSGSQAQLWAFFSFVNQLLGESKCLAAALGLDEQVYRLLTFELFKTAGTLEHVQTQWDRNGRNWTHQLDDLVDFIRENSRCNLTLTDLEEQSHYSARQLQNLFREKFACTPMQFVRRQRLTAAMEKLQVADYDDTVTTIARGIGYRHTSNFTHDFQKEFGINPSVVLRAARQMGGDRREC